MKNRVLAVGSIFFAFAIVYILFSGTVSASLTNRYSMNEGTGTDVYDVIGSLEAEFGSPAPSFETWDTIDGIEFSGGSQFTAGEYVDIVDDDGGYELSSYFEIRARIWLDENSYHYNMIFAKYDYSSPNAYGYQFRIDNGYIRFTIYDGDSTPKNVYSDSQIPEEEWIYVECNYDPVYNKIGVFYYYSNPYSKIGANSYTFSNGDEISYSGSMPDSTIGRNTISYGGYQPFMGRMDALEIED